VYGSGAAGAGATCFLGGTPILMADGSTKSIEQVRIGDMVMSFDEKSLTKVPAKVTQMFDGETAKEYLLVNGHLMVTPNHQVYSKGGWIEIGKAVPGDILLDRDLNEVAIMKIEKITAQNAVSVYNLEVEGQHNYFAGGYLVHNKMAFGELSGSSGVTTTYVGSLYEETGGVGIDHVFLGSTRLASISAGKIQYYHGDHLGGTNVVTNATGAPVELLEYKPFGDFSRRDRLDSSSTTAWYYFTNKPLDDETGLYYYGARYYHPILGRFITPDTIVQAPENPQTLNRYTYCSNNPVNLIDPTGHKWSWGKFWKAAVAAVVSAVVFVATGGTATPVIAGFWAGMAGGAVGGALSGGGWQGVLQGAAFGAVTGAALGGIGAWGVEEFGAGFGWGMLGSAGGYSAATGNLDSFAGGIVGGLAGIGFTKTEQFTNWKAGNGFATDRDVKATQWGKYAKEQRALNINKADKIKIDVVGRYLKDPDSEMSGTMATVRHRGIRGDGIGFDMGPVKGRITVATTEASNFDTFLRTSEYVSNYSHAVNISTVEVSGSGLANMIEAYGNVWGGDKYLFYNYNSNYAVNTIIYGAGGQVPENLGWTFQGK
jgi:RHS repeat-associated protein